MKESSFLWKNAGPGNVEGMTDGHRLASPPWKNWRGRRYEFAQGWTEANHGEAEPHSQEDGSEQGRQRGNQTLTLLAGMEHSAAALGNRPAVLHIIEPRVLLCPSNPLLGYIYTQEN